MAILSARKAEIIKEFAREEGDTGSPEVQIASSRTTSRAHRAPKVHRKDFTSRRGLLMKVGRRTKLLRYLRSRSPERYANLIARSASVADPLAIH